MKRKHIMTAAAVLIVLAGLIAFWKASLPTAFTVKEDEIGIRIRLDLNEDIGLVIYDYTADGHEFSGGVSHADKSPIRHDEELTDAYDRKMLDSEKDTVDFRMRISIVTEYSDPNFDNIYPEESVVSSEALLWEAKFGEIYTISVSGSKAGGYTAVLE